MIRILLVDDQNLVQQGIKSLLEQDQNFQVIGTVEDGKSAIKQINLLKPDIVLLDIEMPGMNGISVTKYINHFLPEIKVIILSSHEEKKYLVQALVAGASSYILKSSLMKDLKQAILAVNNGYSLIESRLLARVLNSGTVKLVPVKSEMIQYTSEPKIEKSTKQNERIHDESDLILIGKDEVRKETDDQLLEANSKDMAATPMLVHPNNTQPKNIHSSQDQSSTESKVDVKSGNLDGISSNASANTVAKDSSNPSNTVLEIKKSDLDHPNSEPKIKVQSDSKKSSLKPPEDVEISSVGQPRLKTFEQDKSFPLYNPNLDEPSYQAQIGLNPVSINSTKSGDETALVPHNLSLPSRDNSKIIFGSNVVRSKTKLVLVKNYLDKIYQQPEIQRIAVQIVRIFQLISSKFSFYLEQYIKPLLTKYKPLANRYKSKFIKSVSKRSTQRILSNMGLMILGGIIVLFII